MTSSDLSSAALAALSTEQRNPASAHIDELSTVDLVRVINEEDAKVAVAVATQATAIAQAIEVIVERINRHGRLIYIGAGTSGRLGVLDASECPPTYGTDPGLVVGLIAGGDTALRNSIEGAEDDPEQGAQDLRDIGLTANDTVVGIAASGRTPYVLGALAYATNVGAATVGLSNSANSKVATASQIAITPLPGPEVVTGSTRMKAGTAQKLVLNTISTGVMIRLGKTFGNLMVDVKTSNAKLQIRAVNIVREATGLDADAAEVLLAASGGEVKTAIVGSLLSISPNEARTKLENAGGIVARALRHD